MQYCNLKACLKPCPFAGEPEMSCGPELNGHACTTLCLRKQYSTYNERLRKRMQSDPALLARGLRPSLFHVNLAAVLNNVKDTELEDQVHWSDRARFVNMMSFSSFFQSAILGR